MKPSNPQKSRAFFPGQTPHSPENRRHGPPAVSRSAARVLLENISAFCCYLLVTALCMRLAWHIPGHGLETIMTRLLVGIWLPCLAAAAACLVLAKSHRKRFLPGFLSAICLISLALFAAARIIATVFRL